ncbi:MAG: arginase family protein, partial [Lachnospiraceae bacterium]|nr:arginase family protein [Lachnospiraceae bacterium]
SGKQGSYAAAVITGGNRVRNRCQNLILDFTHVYEDETVRDREQFQWIDCSDIAESHLYCSPSAYEEIRKRIEPFGISGIHFIDSGNYHYVTKIMTDFLKEPFVLVCFDHHTDMQKPMVEGMTSCGDWAGQVLGENTYLRQLVLIGPPQRDIDGIEIGKPQSQNIQTGEKDKLLTFSEEELQNGTAKAKVAQIKEGLPFYISIDKDVLNRRFTETNWNQGDMPLPMLEHLLQFFLQKGKVCGVDICGECRMDMPLPEYLEAEEINGETNVELYRYVKRHMITE